MKYHIISEKLQFCRGMFWATSSLYVLLFLLKKLVKYCRLAIILHFILQQTPTMYCTNRYKYLHVLVCCLIRQIICLHCVITVSCFKCSFACLPISTHSHLNRCTESDKISNFSYTLQYHVKTLPNANNLRYCTQMAKQTDNI